MSTAASELDDAAGGGDDKRRLIDRIIGPSAVLIVTTALINVLRIGNTMVLTRLLAPGDFGLIAIVLSVFLVISMVTDAGFQAFIVRHERGLDRQFLDAVWTIHFLRGLINATVIGVLAYPIAFALGKMALAPLLAIACLTLAIDGTASLSLLTALRQKMVRRLSLLDLFVYIAQLVVGLAAAWFLRNAYAIVLAMLFSSVTRSLCSYLLFPHARRRFRFDRAIARELWGFSRLIAASSTLTLLISQTDKFVLARLFSLQTFGVYAVAANLANAPVSLAYMYVSRILYPSYAETWRENPAGTRDNFYGMRGLVFYAYLAGGGLMIGAAGIIVRILYDPRYAGASIYLRLLAVTTVMTMLTRPANDLLVAIGKTKQTLHLNIVRVIWLACAGLVGFLLLGPIGLVGALASIELLPYLISAGIMQRMQLYSLRRELPAFAAMALGVAAGLGVDAVGNRIADHVHIGCPGSGGLHLFHHRPCAPR